MTSEDLSGLESLQVLLQQNPNSLTFGRVADALMKLGRVDEAIQLCEDGLRRHPAYVTGHMVLGKCYLKKKLFDQAEKEFKRVLLFDPKYLAAHKYYGDLMREIGWDNTCEMSYRKILQIDPLDEGVRAVIEELTRKVKAEKPEPAPIRRETKPAKEAPAAPPAPIQPLEPIAPIQDEDFFSTTGEAENELLPYQPAAAEEDDEMTSDFATISELPEQDSLTPQAPDADEDRFSYILDDIFQDEVLDEKPAVNSPANKKPPLSNRLESRRDDEFDAGEPMRFLEPPESRQEMDQSAFRSDETNGADSSARPNSRMTTPPVDFDFDEAPPAALNDSEKTSGFDLDEIAPDENKIPVRPSSRPSLPTRPPARRPRLLEDRTQDEPAAISLPSEREKIVTPTLGEIYAAQGQYTKAIGVFELLCKKEPNNRHYREKIDYLKKRLQETQNAG
jgi:tetratricopeptide (TPR) repeat protein